MFNNIIIFIMEERYKIIRSIGMGGMAEVFLVMEKETATLWAMKLLKSSFCNELSFIKRFLREATLMSELKHRGIIKLKESGLTQTNRPYIISQYMDGGNFQNIINDKRKSFREKLILLRPIMEALQYAHDNGVVHRDVKPQNILLNSRGEIKLADFGIAFAYGNDTMGLTRTGEMLGTLDFIAPEQRKDASRVDGRADIYSLGVILFVMATGFTPLGVIGKSLKKSGKIGKKEVAIIKKSLENDPKDRYSSVKDLMSELYKESEQYTAPIIKEVKKIGEVESLMDTLLNGSHSEKILVSRKIKQLKVDEFKKNIGKYLEEARGLSKNILIDIIGDFSIQGYGDLLLNYLKDSTYSQSAALALAKIGDRRVVAGLIEILREKGENSYIALRPLALLKEESAVTDMAYLIDTPYSWVREILIETLYAIKGKKAISLMKKMLLKEKDEDLKALIKNYLVNMKG